jgi:hypothetical protein
MFPSMSVHLPTELLEYFGLLPAVYTMWIPSLNMRRISLVMVNHIRTDDHSVISTSSSAKVKKLEHMFAILWGFPASHMGKILDFWRSQEQSQEQSHPSGHLRRTGRLTPEELLARVIQNTDDFITRGLRNISERLDPSEEDMTEEQLAKENGTLWNIRSTIHRLNGLIDPLLNKLDFINASYENWLGAQSAGGIIHQTRSSLRRERFEMVRQSIEQNRIEAQILQEHVTLNISKVSFYMLL